MKSARKLQSEGGAAPVTALAGRAAVGLRAAVVVRRDGPAEPAPTGSGGRGPASGTTQATATRATGVRAGAWIVRVGGQEFTATADDAVDPALLDEAARSGARVLIDMDTGGDAGVSPTPTDAVVSGLPAGQGAGHPARATAAVPVIIGVLQTQRALTIDRQGVVEAAVNKLRLTAHHEMLLSAPRTFLRLKAGEVEVYGDRVITRAREIAKTLARMISLN